MALVALIAAARVASHPDAAQAFRTRDLGASTPYTVPAFVETDNALGLVWQPQLAGGSPPLVYSPMDGDARDRALLPYPGIAPDAWQAVSAGDSAYHLIWREENGTLRSALVDTQGQTLRGPIALSFPASARFRALALPGGEALILAWEPGGSRLAAVRIDAAGRPRPFGARTFGPEQIVAAQIDADGMLHVVWVAPPSNDAAALNVASGSPNDFAAEAALPVRQIGTLAVSVTDTVTSLDLGFDSTDAYILTGITTAEHPDVQQIWLTSFPIADPAAATTSMLVLPESLPAWNPADPPALSADSNQPAAQRWAGFASGAQGTLHAALAVRTQSGWQAAIVGFRAGKITAAGLLDAPAVDGGPITAAVDGEGAPWLAWTTLQGVEPHLILAGYGDDADPAPDAVSALLAGIAGLPFALLWLVAPVFVLISPSAHPQAALWLASALYSAAKLLIPPALLAHGPWLADSATSPLAAAVTLALIALIAAVIYRVAQRARLSPWAQWLAYGATDAVLTWLAFGINTVSR
ncbi:hypothetical protein [Aggregatilinea lenta]|uniref:hypothetical protein n=1 Tax=Aggregatilinea lenta TaxID=913108 RepID=UPI000E5B5350|nr:hypothetical protein [Aggregatilinea lenta]